MTLKELEACLKIDPDDLDGDIIRQPQLFYSVAVLLASAISERDRSKDAVTVEYARGCERGRAHLEKIGEKVTESRVKLMADEDAEYLEKRELYTQCRETCDVLLGLKEAYSQRAFALKDLAHLQISGSAMSGSVRVGERASTAAVARDVRAEAQKLRDQKKPKPRTSLLNSR